LDARVSVVIPAYNAQDTIVECVRSALRQTLKPIEVIVADNYSVDETVKLARGLGVTVLERCGRPGNPASARNAGFRVARGDFILFLDSDEVLERDVVRECVDICVDGGVGMVKIPLVFVGDGFWSRCSAFWKNCHYRVCRRATGNVPRFFVRRLLPNSPFNEELACKEDWDLYRRMRSRGVGEAYCSSRMVHLEPRTLREMVVKNMRYSVALSSLSRQVGGTYGGIARHVVSTFLEALRKPPRNPLILAGCVILLLINAYLMAMGLIRERLLGIKPIPNI